jgi:hypothetical protein
VAVTDAANSKYDNEFSRSKTDSQKSIVLPHPRTCIKPESCTDSLPHCLRIPLLRATKADTILQNASKGALHQYANTLRVELAPFGVKVITVVTGGVSSQLSLHVTRTLPPNSYYAPLEDVYQHRLRHAAEVGVTPHAFAEDVVPQIVPGGGPWPWRLLVRDARKKWIWAGGQNGRVWFFSGGWLWSGIFDFYFTMKFKLSTLVKRQKSD